MIKFETNKKYFARSIGDSNCVWTFEVIRRTAKSVWIQGDTQSGRIERKKLFEFEGRECFKPLGSYSMSPTVKADREV